MCATNALRDDERKNVCDDAPREAEMIAPSNPSTIHHHTRARAPPPRRAAQFGAPPSTIEALLRVQVIARERVWVLSAGRGAPSSRAARRTRRAESCRRRALRTAQTRRDEGATTLSCARRVTMDRGGARGVVRVSFRARRGGVCLFDCLSVPRRAAAAVVLLWRPRGAAARLVQARHRRRDADPPRGGERAAGGRQVPGARAARAYLREARRGADARREGASCAARRRDGARQRPSSSRSVARERAARSGARRRPSSSRSGARERAARSPARRALPRDRARRRRTRPGPASSSPHAAAAAIGCSAAGGAGPPPREAFGQPRA